MESGKKRRTSIIGNQSSLENNANENDCLKVDADCSIEDGDVTNPCNSHSREKSSYEFSHLLSKAKNLEKKNNRAQFQQAEEVGSEETGNSVKENIVDHSEDREFPNSYPSAVRKKAFEMRKQQSRIRASTPKNDQSSDVAAGQPGVQPVSSMAQSSTPRLSVRERVASFNSPDGFQGIPQNPQQAVPLQNVTPPPNSIQMSYTNQTPSMFSPMETFVSPNRRRQSAINQSNSPYKKHYNNNRGICSQGSRSYPTPSSLDSPGDSDDYEDGITLSPTCSEVSGLTLPTCLGGFEEKPKKKSNTLDCMSPIARHRQIKGVHSSGTLFNHPYLKRMMSPKASGQLQQQQQQSQQSSSPEVKAQSHRQQIISRVVEKPSSRKSQGAPNKKPSIKKSASNQSTLTTAPSNVSEVCPNSKQQPERMGKVAERVAMLSERGIGGNTNQIATQSAKETKTRYTKRTIEEQSSTATRDCVRLN